MIPDVQIVTYGSADLRSESKYSSVASVLGELSHTSCLVGINQLRVVAVHHHANASSMKVAASK
jgi:hypothetical protein